MIDTLKLKAIIAEKQLLQADLIEMTGLSPYTISRTISGLSEPNLSTIGKICKAIEISPAEILTEDH